MLSLMFEDFVPRKAQSSSMEMAKENVKRKTAKVKARDEHVKEGSDKNGV